VRKEVASQMRSMGAATQSELDALRKRVRDLERATGMTASGRTKTSARKTPARKASVQKTTSRTKTGARKTKTAASRRKSSSAS